MKLESVLEPELVLEPYILIDELLTDRECSRIIEKFESITNKFVNDQSEYQNFEDSDLADLIELRILEIIRDFFGFVFGISPNFELIKYCPESSYIGNHVDGHEYSGKMYSVYTVLIYLNTCENGGTILEDRGEDLEICPITGRLLLLEQETCHRTIPPSKGHKYVLKTNLVKNDSNIFKA